MKNLLYIAILLVSSSSVFAHDISFQGHIVEDTCGFIRSTSNDCITHNVSTYIQTPVLKNTDNAKILTLTYY